MLRRRINLLIGRGIPAEAHCNTAEFEADSAIFVQSMVNHSNLPLNPPVEFHPYLQHFPLMLFDKYIIGTFPPISYVCDLVNLNFMNHPDGRFYFNRPRVPFFLGNLASMWQFLLDTEQIGELNEILTQPENARVAARQYLIQFLLNCQINYSDIIKRCQRLLKNGHYQAEDTSLTNICINHDLVSHIMHNNKIKMILFNTGSPFRREWMRVYQNNVLDGLPGQINIGQVQAFDIFVRACQELGMFVEFRLRNVLPWTVLSLNNFRKLTQTFRTKIIFEIKLTHDNIEKAFTVITPPSPAAHGNVNENPVVVNGFQLLGLDNLHDLLTYIYQQFKFGNEEALYQLNCHFDN